MLHLARSICETFPRSDALDLLSDIHHGLGAWANQTNQAEESLQYNTRYLQMRLDAIAHGGEADNRTAAAYNQKGTGWMMFKSYDFGKRDFRLSIKTYRALPD